MIKGWLRILLLPVICIVWMLGWLLYNAGSTAYGEKAHSLGFNSAKSLNNSSEIPAATTSQM